MSKTKQVAAWVIRLALALLCLWGGQGATAWLFLDDDEEDDDEAARPAALCPDCGQQLWRYIAADGTDELYCADCWRYEPAA